LAPDESLAMARGEATTIDMENVTPNQIVEAEVITSLMTPPYRLD
jgi:hypothetical protein